MIDPPAKTVPGRKRQKFKFRTIRRSGSRDWGAKPRKPGCQQRREITTCPTIIPQHSFTRADPSPLARGRSIVHQEYKQPESQPAQCEVQDISFAVFPPAPLTHYFIAHHLGSRVRQFPASALIRSVWPCPCEAFSPLWLGLKITTQIPTTPRRPA